MKKFILIILYFSLVSSISLAQEIPEPDPMNNEHELDLQIKLGHIKLFKVSTFPSKIIKGKGIKTLKIYNSDSLKSIPKKT